jgi:two-component system, OmpR family, sensor kinase
VSLRARLLAASLVLLALGLVVADVATYGSLRSFLYNRVDAQLDAAHRSVERAVFSPDGPFAAAQLRQLGAVVPGVYVQVRDGGDNVIVTVEGRARDAPSSAPRLPDRVVSITPAAGPDVVPGNEPARLLTLSARERGGPRYRVRVSSLPGGGALVVALPLRDTFSTLHHLLLIELLVSIGVLAAAAAGGLWLVRLGLRPLADIEGTAGAIAAGDMRNRVARDDDRSEVGRLGHALNVMLDTIDEAMAEQRASEQRVRRFVADASHELRTPVAAVRAYAELYRRGADQHPEDLARLLSRIEQESARIGVLVDDLVLLTRLDEGRPLQRTPVDLGAIASDAVEAARALEPDRPITLEVSGSVEVPGDRHRLRQVVDNLLANVRAHTPAGSPADVRVWATGGRATVEVADRGNGLTAEDASQVFERFYRVDPARSRHTGGAGLGLSIVAAIAAAHGGSAAAEARPGGGAVFRVELPLLSPEPGPEPPPA